jgi:hypothetical protein
MAELTVLQNERSLSSIFENNRLETVMRGKGDLQ